MDDEEDPRVRFTSAQAVLLNEELDAKILTVQADIQTLNEYHSFYLEYLRQDVHGPYKLRLARIRRVNPLRDSAIETYTQEHLVHAVDVHGREHKAFVRTNTREYRARKEAGYVRVTINTNGVTDALQAHHVGHLGGDVLRPMARLNEVYHHRCFVMWCAWWLHIVAVPWEFNMAVNHCWEIDMPGRGIVGSVCELRLEQDRIELPLLYGQTEVCTCINGHGQDVHRNDN
jgi:hypothetical protein